MSPPTELRAPGSDPICQATEMFGAPRPDGAREYSSHDLMVADRQGLLGAVNREIEAGRIVVGPDASAQLRTLSHHVASEAVLLEARAAGSVEMLRERGIETRVLKGLAVANLDYDDPTCRQFGDVDLLVRGSDMAAAVAAFAEHGFRRHFVEPFEGFDEFIGKGVAVEDETRTVVDLHRTLALGYFGTRLPVDEIWDDAEDFELAGVRMHALSRERRFVHCALHHALAPVDRISHSLDLCVIAGASELDSAEVMQLSERWGCAYPVSLAIRATVERFGPGWASPELVDWSATQHRAATMRFAMAAFEGPLAGSRLRSLTAVLGLRSAALRRKAIRGVVTRGHHERE